MALVWTPSTTTSPPPTRWRRPRAPHGGPPTNDAACARLYRRPGQEPRHHGVKINTSTPLRRLLLLDAVRRRDRRPWSPPTRPLDVYAVYEHRGDRQAAARAIAEQTGILAAWQAEQDAGLGFPTPPPAATADDGLPTAVDWAELFARDRTAGRLADRRPVARGRLISLTAPRKERKSLLMLYLAACLAAGRDPWTGRRAHRRRRRLPRPRDDRGRPPRTARGHGLRRRRPRTAALLPAPRPCRCSTSPKAARCCSS